MIRRSVDWVFFGIVATLVSMGVFFFVSAAFGVMARSAAKFSGIIFSQLVFGVGLGLLGLFIATQIDYKLWKRYSLFLFLAAFFSTFLVFVPNLGFEHGGAKRWIHIGSVSFQPSEALKLGAILYAAAWFSAIREKIHDYRFGLGPLIGFLALTAIPLLLQPDTGTYLVIAAGIIGVYFAAGGRWAHIGLIILSGVLMIALLAITKPYVMDRLTTFMNPDDTQGSAYQIRQSLIAIGSGGLLGRGFGQSVQKFQYLPEPIGDSIFAVIGEEMGFLGTSLLVLFYLFFAARGMIIASKSPDKFSGLLVTGIVILIISQSFLNIGSMLAVTPLTGVPLVFVSHGGTALLVTLFEVGIILGISRYRH